MDEIVKEFPVESYASLDRLERDFVVLEKNPHDQETLGNIFRTLHTFKGTSGFLGYGRVEATGEPGERDYCELIELLTGLNDGGTSAKPLLAPITAPATAVAVPASRRYAAADPHPVAVVAPACSSIEDPCGSSEIEFFADLNVNPWDDDWQ